MKEQYRVIPERTLETLEAYVRDHRPPGGFLQAVLSNNLKEALGKADRENLLALKEIVGWVYWECPYKAQGTLENYRAWVSRFRQGSD